MSQRPKHPLKELESVLQKAEELGWRCERGKRYYKMKCACGQHMKMMHISPSGQNYLRNLVAWLQRSGCWEED